MTEKQQAREICNDFYLYSAHQNSVKVRSEQAKYCALKCVDRIILSNPHSNPLNTKPESTMEFWQGVKKEIEKLK